MSDWIDVLAAGDVVEGAGKDVVAGESIVAVFRYEGELFALDALCSHQGGPIADGSIGRDLDGHACVTCPWHGWQYELETGIQCINRQPLQSVFPVREVDGRIQLQLPNQK